MPYYAVAPKKLRRDQKALTCCGAPQIPASRTHPNCLWNFIAACDRASDPAATTPPPPPAHHPMRRSGLFSLSSTPTEPVPLNFFQNHQPWSSLPKYLLVATCPRSSTGFRGVQEQPSSNFTTEIWSRWPTCTCGSTPSTARICISRPLVLCGSSYIFYLCRSLFLFLQCYMLHNVSLIYSSTLVFFFEMHRGV
jgi:hypothetical protein